MKHSATHYSVRADKGTVIADDFQPSFFLFLLTFLSNLPLHLFSLIFLILLQRPEQNMKITLEALLSNKLFYLSLFLSKSNMSFQSSPIKAELS